MSRRRRAAERSGTRARQALAPTLCLVVCAAQAQAEGEGAPARWRLEPTAELSQTLTSNVQPGTVGSGADGITRGTLGLSVRKLSGPVRLKLDYELTANLHARYSGLNRLQQGLRASGDWEWFDHHGTLAADASISRQAISAFSFQPGAGAALSSSNTTELQQLRLAPRWVGLLPGDLRLTANADQTFTNAESTDVGDGARSQLGVQIAPMTSGTISWSLEAQGEAARFKRGQHTDTERLFGTVSWRLVDYDTQLNASLGEERSNISTQEHVDGEYWRLGGEWTPTPRTRLSAQVGHEAFGRSHQLAFEHRFPLTALRFSDSRSVSSSGTTTGTTVLGTAGDTLNALYAASVPDPVRRAELVAALLQANGLRSDALVSAGFLSASATVQERQEFSVGTRWPRGSALLSYSRGSTRRANLFLVAADDLGSASEIRTSGLNFNVSHYLTPTMSVTLNLGGTRSSGQVAAQHHTQRTANLMLADQLSKSIGWTIGLRRSLFDSAAQAPYNESALIATLALRF